MAHKVSLNSLIDELNALNDQEIEGPLVAQISYGEEGAPTSLRYAQAVRITVELIPDEED